MDDRLTPLDVSNLRVERRGVPMHVAVLLRLDRGPLDDLDRQAMLAIVRDHVASRVGRAPRLGQLLRPAAHGRGLCWVRAPRFDVRDHVHAVAVDPPGDEAALLETCLRVNAGPLDRSRPLWELWLLTGAADGTLAVLVRVHHVVADGLALLDLLSCLVDPIPAAAAARPSASPAPVHGRRTVTVAAARQLVSLLRHPRAPVLSVNRPVGARRTLVLLRGDLAGARLAAHRQGGTVNDVVLAAVAGGLRRLLLARGEPVAGVAARVSVAASVRRPGDLGGNRVGVRVVAVPLDEPDARACLGRVVAASSAQRSLPPFQPAGRLLQRWMVHVMNRQRMVNVLLSNVPGPQEPLAFAGVRVREMFQVGVVQGNLALAVGVLSYDGRLGIDVVADADVVPDAAVFAEGVAETLTALGAGPPVVAATS